MKHLDPTVAAIGVMVVFLFVVAWQQTHPAQEPTSFFEASHEACDGEPIVVSYAYKGTPEDPHECIVQCRDQKPHYILYNNGLGTQCDDLPGCNDRGEDDGVTCDPPTGSVK